MLDVFLPFFSFSVGLRYVIKFSMPSRPSSTYMTAGQMKNSGGVVLIVVAGGRCDNFAAGYSYRS